LENLRIGSAARGIAILKSSDPQILKSAPSLPASSKVTIGQPVPAFSVNTIHGARLDIASLRGKRVLVFMWASW